jgi:vacuolar-type H+-ATPase subunit E/Vma4
VSVILDNIAQAALEDVAQIERDANRDAAAWLNSIVADVNEQAQELLLSIPLVRAQATQGIAKLNGNNPPCFGCQEWCGQCAG